MSRSKGEQCAFFKHLFKINICAWTIIFTVLAIRGWLMS